jgi:hypothetical protein
LIARLAGRYREEMTCAVRREFVALSHIEPWKLALGGTI